MATYRVLKGSYTQYDEGQARVFNPGDTIELTEEAMKAQGEANFEPGAATPVFDSGLEP